MTREVQKNVEKRNRKLYRMFTKWSLSYVILSTVGILVIFFCTMKYNEVVRSYLEYSFSLKMYMVQIKID